MDGIVRRVALAVLLLAVVGVTACGDQDEGQVVLLTPTTSDRFNVGQVWRYKARVAEPDSRVVIGRIEASPKIGTIIHVKFVGMRIENPDAPGGVSEALDHAPVAEAQVAASVTELSDEAPDLDGFEDAYSTWLASFKEGDAGVFTIPLSEISEVIEQALR